MLVTTATLAVRGAVSARCVLCVSGVAVSTVQVRSHMKLFCLGMSGRELTQAAAGGGCQHIPGAAEVEGQRDDSGCHWQAAATRLCP